MTGGRGGRGGRGRYHVFLVAVNTTTNETFKWKDLRRDIRARDRNQQRRAARAEAGEPEPEKECPEARRLRAILLPPTPSSAPSCCPPPRPARRATGRAHGLQRRGLTQKGSNGAD